MTRAVAPCSFGKCARTTTDPSGRCHDHRSTSAAPVKGGLPLPVPTAAWVSGAGVPHPNGGYDEVREDEEEDDDGGVGIVITYRRKGTLHRTDGPASIVHASGGGRVETYVLDGKISRDAGPAIVTFDEGGDVPTLEEYIEGQRVSRTDGPALREYEDGHLVREVYAVAGIYHRLDGPAVIEYPGGEIEWKEHRIGADEITPSVDLDGVSREWFVHGDSYSEEDFGRLREALDGGAPYEWARSYVEGGKG